MTLEELLQQQGVPCHEGGSHRHVREGWVGVDCPWCGSLGKFHLGISMERRYASCWVCGSHRLGDTLMKVTDQPWPVVRDWLDALFKGHRDVVRRPKPRGRLVVPPGLGPLTKPYKRYLRQRGFDPEQVARVWGVKATGAVGPLSWRLWIPILYRGELVSWTTRAIGENTARYISAGDEQEKVPAKSILYGSDLAQHAIVLVEGPLDAWAIGPGAVATLGLGCTESQLLEAGKYPVRVICFDSQPQAQKRARAVAQHLQSFPGDTHLVTLESGKDAAESDTEELEELRRLFLT